MSETMEQLEEICDAVAFAIDNADGRMNITEVQEIVDKLLADTDYEPAQFNEMFENIYLCDVHQYMQNSVDDAAWATEEGIVEDTTNLENLI